MDIELIKAPHRARPFRVFAIHTASGEVDAVKHPANSAITVDEIGLVVSPSGGQVALIDAGSVTEITYGFNRKSSSNSDA